jgi:hypothetical protein
MHITTPAARPHRLLSHRGRRIMKTAALATALLTFGGTAVASASNIASDSGTANVRTCGSISCAVVDGGTLYNGTGVNMTAWCDSEWVDPPNSDYSSDRWFKIDSPVAGWVHSSLVDNQQTVDFNCFA